jgi:hypothetical protein
LNNPFGAKLRITYLRAPNGGPGIEVLEYLAPHDGRPLPPDEHANDLVHRQTTPAVASVDKTAQSLYTGTYSFISPGAVRVTDGRRGIAKALLVPNPEGHVMAVVEKWACNLARLRADKR